MSVTVMRKWSPRVIKYHLCISYLFHSQEQTTLLTVFLFTKIIILGDPGAVGQFQEIDSQSLGLRGWKIMGTKEFLLVVKQSYSEQATK